MARVLVLVLVELLVLAALCIASIDISKAITRCSRIGISSGCSGCENEHSGCEWCAKWDDASHSFDDVFRTPPYSTCAPKGHCNDIPLPSPRNWEYKSRGEVCAGDPKKQIKILSLNPYDYLYNKQYQELSNGFFDSHYCEFASEPHVVDRFSNFLGADDPIVGCHLINAQLLVGTRGQIDNWLKSTRQENWKGLTAKDKACLSLFQSAACTTRCPQYGVAARFDELCYEFCDRIENHCEGDLLAFLENNVGVLSRVTCKAKDDKDCFMPVLIPASGLFEFDECLFGDPKRCRTSNCVVEPIEGPFVLPPGYPTTKKRDISSVAASEQGPPPAICCWDEGAAFSCGDAVFTQEFRIKDIGTPDGLSCEDAVWNFIIETYGDRFSQLGPCGCPECHDTDGDGVDDVCWDFFSLVNSDPLSQSCTPCGCDTFYPECEGLGEGDRKRGGLSASQVC